MVCVNDFVGKYAVLVMVVDKVIDAVASASKSFDTITLSMVMNAFLSCDSNIRGKDGNQIGRIECCPQGMGALAASADVLNLYSAASLMRAMALNGDVLSANRILVALEGRGGSVVDEKEVAVWPGTESANRTRTALLQPSLV